MASSANGVESVVLNGLFPPGTALPVAQAAPAESSAPLEADILAGSVVAAGTLLSLNPGDVWYGFFTLSASLVGTNKTATVTIQNTGGTATPSTTLDLLSLSLGTGTATDAVQGDQRSNSMYIRAGVSANDVTVTVAGNPAILSANAYGYLLS